jgi:hypothetical protein
MAAEHVDIGVEMTLDNVTSPTLAQESTDLLSKIEGKVGMG